MYLSRKIFHSFPDIPRGLIMNPFYLEYYEIGLYSHRLLLLFHDPDIATRVPLYSERDFLGQVRYVRVVIKEQRVEWTT
jgi:hypothetical protein